MTRNGKRTVEVVYLITSDRKAEPAGLAAKAVSKCMSVPGRYCWRMDREPTGAESGTLMVKECASAAHTGTVRLPGTS